MAYIFAILLGYFLGCSSFAYYISKLKKIDIRQFGSKNLGAANSTYVLGWKYGVMVGIHDIGKAIIAVLLTKHLFPDAHYATATAGVACVIGHIFPPPLKFKGGKGFASFLGLTIALNWKCALIAVILLVAISLITDYLVMGTFATVSMVPIYMGFTSKNPVCP